MVSKENAIMKTPKCARRIRGVTALAAIAFSTLPAPSRAAVQGNGGSVTFDAMGPAGFKLQGKTSAVSVSETGGTVRVSVGLATLDTGIELRNRHMREKYLEVQKYPNAMLVVDRSTLRLPDEGRESTGSANGTITIHGQSRPVSFTYKVHRNREAFDVTGSVRVNMNDYGIQVPSYLGITVKPDVDIVAGFVAHDT
jgi:polyisoprenoid-binding protein YceI